MTGVYRKAHSIESEVLGSPKVKLRKKPKLRVELKPAPKIPHSAAEAGIPRGAGKPNQAFLCSPLSLVTETRLRQVGADFPSKRSGNFQFCRILRAEGVALGRVLA